jgi:hypothetical protein
LSEPTLLHSLERKKAKSNKLLPGKKSHFKQRQAHTQSCLRAWAGLLPFVMGIEVKKLGQMSTAMDNAKALIAKKDEIEAQIRELEATLRMVTITQLLFFASHWTTCS